jgi:hypothetical protein
MRKRKFSKVLTTLFTIKYNLRVIKNFFNDKKILFFLILNIKNLIINII